MLPDEGLPGENRTLSITDTVTLHLLDSQFSGSGRTAVMTPTVTFGPVRSASTTLSSASTGPDGGVQDDDVLGQITIAPAACPFPVDGVTVSGPESGQTNTDYVYTANVTPLNATQPISYTWSPEPKSGRARRRRRAICRRRRNPLPGRGKLRQLCGRSAHRTHQTTSAPDLAIHKRRPGHAVAGGHRSPTR
ncbi:MAG: hypothetical protein R2911_37415 [Caldilineaceae bacterium]